MAHHSGFLRSCFYWQQLTGFHFCLATVNGCGLSTVLVVLTTIVRFMGLVIPTLFPISTVAKVLMNGSFKSSYVVEWLESLSLVVVVQTNSVKRHKVYRRPIVRVNFA